MNKLFYITSFLLLIIVLSGCSKKIEQPKVSPTQQTGAAESEMPEKSGKQLQDEAREISKLDIEKAEQICENITSQERQAWCYQDISVELSVIDINKSQEICNKIKSPFHKDECFDKLASKVTDEDKALELCNFTEIPSLENICKAKITARTDFEKAKSICEEIEDAQDKERCEILIFEE